GGMGNDLLFGLYGNNHFVGGDGEDTVFYSGDATITTGITADLADPSHNTGLAAGDTYDGVENVLGSILDDTLIGDDGNNVLMGSFGNDRLIGGAGADVLNGGYFYSGDITDWYEGTPLDTLDPSDVASYETATSGVIASLSNPANNTGDAAGDTYFFIDGLAGSAFDDSLVGTQYRNLLTRCSRTDDTTVRRGG